MCDPVSAMSLAEDSSSFWLTVPLPSASMRACIEAGQEMHKSRLLWRHKGKVLCMQLEAVSIQWFQRIIDTFIQYYQTSQQNEAAP
jgi:hypothetical protein